MSSRQENRPAINQDNSRQVEQVAAMTNIKVPLVKPNPGLLKVLHLSGAKGETFTMQEVTHHVIQYIKNKVLYDPNDVRVVYCGGDPLGEAFKVSRFTINDALGLIHRNCKTVQDPCLCRQVATPDISFRNEQGIPSASNVVSSVQPGRISQSGTFSHLTEASHLDSSTHSVHSTSSAPSSSHGVSQPTPQALSHYRRAAKAAILIHESELNDAAVSSSEESTCDRPKRARTSSNLNLDEPDTCCPTRKEVASNQNPKNDTVFVEIDSDAFSVEYEVESSSDNDDPMETQLDGSLESDVSSSTSGQAALLIVCETDLEYLADYSDTDEDSDAELTEADKWCCVYCQLQNPPFQRNCGGCWSVRPDWLPSRSVISENETSATSQENCTMESASSSQTLQTGSFYCLASSQNSSQNNQADSQNSALSSVTSSRKKRDSLTSDTDDTKDIEMDGEKKSGQTTPRKKSLSDEACVICLTRKKTAVLVHGKTGHQACCYSCGKKLKKQRRACPICRRPIQKVIRNYT